MRFHSVTRFPGLTRVLSALMLAAGLAACGEDVQIQQYVESGKAFAAKNDDAAAVIQFKNALQNAPEDAEVRYLLGSALRRLGDFPAAEIELRKAVSLGFQGQIARFELASALLDLGQARKALEEIELLTAGRATPDILALRGDALAALGQTDGARNAYDEALREDPANAGALLGTARLAAVQGDFPGAAATLAQVLAAQPDNFNARLLEANLLTREGKTAEAIQSYDKALAIRPGDLRVYAALVPALLLVKDIDGADRKLESLRKASPGAPMTAYLDSLVAYARGDRVKARASIQAVLKAVPEDNRARLLAGTVEHDLGNYAAAERLLSRVLEAAPGDPQSRFLLASSQFRMGQIAKAAKLLDPLVDERASRQILMLAAEIAVGERNPAKAVSLFERAIALEDDPAVRMRLGVAKIAAGDADGGVRDLKAAIASNPKDGSADLSLAAYYLSTKQTDRARAVATALVARLPDAALSHQVMGDVLLAEKDRAGARQSFERALKVAPAFLPSARALADLDMQDRRPEAAVTRLRGVVAADPKQRESVLLLARALQQTNAPPADVIAVLDQAIAANPVEASLYVAKVEVLGAQGDRRAALAAAQEALGRFPEDRTTVFVAARAHEAAGERPQALALFGKASTIAPDWSAPFLGQAAIQATDKDYAAARLSLERALQAEPGNLAAQLALVDVHVKSGNLAQARATVAGLRQRTPKLAAGYIADAGVRLADNDATGAERVLREGLAATDDRDALVRLYALLLEQKRSAEAEREVTAWNARHASSIAGMMAAADVRLARSELKDAERWYRSALRLQPDNPIVLNNLAWVLGQAGDTSSVDIARKALEKAPGNPVILDTLGALLADFGKPSEGIAMLNDALKTVPNSPVLFISLAKAQVKAGNGEEARKALDAATRLAINDEQRKQIEAVSATIR